MASKKKTTTRRKKRGGKFIARGTYGCVFGEPPLKCTQDMTRYSDEYVSKVMDLTSAVDEYTESSLWNKIDPDNEFSLTPTERCRLDTEDIQASNQFDKCNLKFENMNLRYLLISKNGGMDLDRLPVMAKNYEGIFTGFQGLFDGIVKAHAAGFAHTDIKPMNILVGYKDIHLRFIDFGLTEKTKNKTSYHRMYTDLQTYYYYWPFEFGCFDTEGELYSKMLVEIRFINFQNNIANDDYGIPQFTIPFDDLYETYIAMYAEDGFKNVQMLMEKMDVFSLAITIAELMVKYFNHRIISVDAENFYNFYFDSKKYGRSRFLTLPDKKWLTPEQLAFQQNLFNNVTVPLTGFLNKCLHYDPRVRLGSKEAAEEYRKLLPIFKTYLKEDDVRKGLSGMNIIQDETPATPAKPINGVTPVTPVTPVEGVVSIKLPSIPSPVKTKNRINQFAKMNMSLESNGSTYVSPLSTAGGKRRKYKKINTRKQKR